MKKLASLIHELETKIPFSAKSNNAVSKEPVGWHIQHSLLVALQVITALERSNPAYYKPAFNLRKFIIYSINKIPRGKAKAPESVLPKTAINSEELNKNFALLKTRIHVLEDLQPRSFFKHPYFGNLHVKESIKMIRLHTRHHIDIINDIIRG
ncbi:MAG: hypothetical protein ACKOU7_03040 [Ferruginibacter sp.]